MRGRRQVVSVGNPSRAAKRIGYSVNNATQIIEGGSERPERSKSETPARNEPFPFRSASSPHLL